MTEPISDGRYPFGDVIAVVNRTRGTTRDAAGNVVPAKADPIRYIGAFDPAIGFESTNSDEDRVSTQPGVYLPYVAVVKPSSLITVETGRHAGDYEVDGEPAYWKNPHSGATPGVQVPLRRSTG